MPRAPKSDGPIDVLTAFTGFERGALDFYRDLHDDNTREFWLANKARFEAQIAVPTQSLAAELSVEFGAVTVFRPYRDIRFSKDKRVYQEHASMATDGAEALYLQLSASGLLLAGGYHSPARDQLQRFRELQDDGRKTRALDRRIDDLRDAGFTLGDGRQLKTAPRGWARDHPRIELLRLTEYTVERTLEPGDWLYDRGALQIIIDEWHTISTWNAWLADHIGPSTEPLERR